MDDFQAFDEKTEVGGRVMLSFLNCTLHDDLVPILKTHTLTQIDPEAWYPQQVWLNALKDIQIHFGFAAYHYVSIGMKVMASIVLPPELATLPFEKFLMARNGIYQKQHRNGYAGEYQVNQPSEKHVTVRARVPYPDDMIYGSVYADARRLLASTTFVVRYDDNEPRRNQGGEWTTMHITWN